MQEVCPTWRFRWTSLVAEGHLWKVAYAEEHQKEMLGQPAPG